MGLSTWNPPCIDGLTGWDCAGALTPATIAAGGGLAVVAYKPDDQAVNNSSDLVDDVDLLFAVGADEVWRFTTMLWLSGPSAADAYCQWAVPAGGSSMLWGGAYGLIADGGINAIDLTTVAANDKDGTLSIFVPDDPVLVAFDAIYRGSGAAGNIQFRWAQLTPTVGDTVVRRGSHILGARLA